MFITFILAFFKKDDSGVSKSDSLLNVFVLGLSLGFISFVNTWDYPAYAAFTLFAFVLLKMRLFTGGDSKGSVPAASGSEGYPPAPMESGWVKKSRHSRDKRSLKIDLTKWVFSALSS